VLGFGGFKSIPGKLGGGTGAFGPIAASRSPPPPAGARPGGQPAPRAGPGLGGGPVRGPPGGHDGALHDAADDVRGRRTVGADPPRTNRERGCVASKGGSANPGMGRSIVRMQVGYAHTQSINMDSWLHGFSRAAETSSAEALRVCFFIDDFCSPFAFASLHAFGIGGACGRMTLIYKFFRETRHQLSFPDACTCIDANCGEPPPPPVGRGRPRRPPCGCADHPPVAITLNHMTTVPGPSNRAAAESRTRRWRRLSEGACTDRRAIFFVVM